jgi:hypothetical protein
MIPAVQFFNKMGINLWFYAGFHNFKIRNPPRYAWHLNRKKIGFYYLMMYSISFVKIDRLLAGA